MENIEFKEIIDLWKEKKKNYVKNSTYAAYNLIVKKHIEPILGKESNLTEELVEQFYKNRIEYGLSEKSAIDVMIVLKMIIKFAINLGWLKNFSFESRKRLKQEKCHISALSRVHQKKLMNFIEENFTFKNLGIYICLCSGIRIGEICALKWGDIDLQKKTINIKRTIQRIYHVEDDKTWTELIIDSPKTINGFREIPLSKNLVGTIKLLKKIVNDEYFVISNDSKPIEPRTYRNYFTKLITNLNIPKINFHGLRHSFATRCIESNCDYKTLSSILGHSNISTTLNLYVHPTLEHKQHCIAKMLKNLNKGRCDINHMEC